MQIIIKNTSETKIVDGAVVNYQCCVATPKKEKK
jgi:hypothetical protein